ncbi:GNAT family N-acetyltransferase [bacterium]|nr:GNAT family N-acetyltransferase [bacterium]
MESINIRQAETKDIQTIVQFNCAMARETENKILDHGMASSGVLFMFDHPEYGFYCVAETGQHVVGQLMITYEWSDWRNGVFWWIQSVYVDPAFRTLGVFKKLYAYISEKSRHVPNVCGLRLYVETNNDRAFQIYRHLGMSEAHYRMMEVDYVLST